MAVHTVFLHLVAILLAARLFAEVAARLGIPSVVGELLAGIVLGPSLLGWVPPGEAVKLLAEIGIILLLFEVGLETDIHRLIRAGGRAFTVAGGGFILPFFFGYALSRWGFGLSQLPALFIGGAPTATSIGVTVRVLADLGRHESREGQIVLGAAVLDDIFGVVFLALLYEFAVSGEVSPVGAGRVLLFVAVFFALATPSAKLISLVIRRYEATSAVPGSDPDGCHGARALLRLAGPRRRRPGVARRVRRRPRPLAALFPAVWTGDPHGPGLRAPRRSADETGRSLVHADLLRDGRAFTEPAGSGLGILLDLGLLRAAATGRPSSARRAVQ